MVWVGLGDLSQFCGCHSALLRSSSPELAGAAYCSSTQAHDTKRYGTVVYSFSALLFDRMTWQSAVFTPVFYWIQLHPISAFLCVIIIVYHVHARLYPDPLMKLPCPSGGGLFGGHIYNIIKWVSPAMNSTSYRLITSVPHIPPSFTRNTSES